jgi:hypothetical protein
MLLQTEFANERCQRWVEARIRTVRLPRNDQASARGKSGQGTSKGTDQEREVFPDIEATQIENHRAR